MTKSDKQKLLISYVNDLDERYLDELISELGLIDDDDDNDFMCDRACSGENKCKEQCYTCKEIFK
jgi:hypothetical protein